jgi:hypothetical protein
MSAAEQLEDAQVKAGLPEHPRAEPSAIEAQLTQTPAAGRAKLRPLLALAPYVARYRARALLAFIALTVAALTTLIVPVAVRRMIDFGFSPEGIAMINSYFSVMIAVVAVLAGASASRHYLVMTIGERVVADLRRDVFAHLISLSPSLLGIGRAAQPDAVHRRHCDDGDHQPAAVRRRAARDPADRGSACGVRALGAPAVARRAGYAGGSHRLCLRTGRRDPHRAGLYR